MEKTQKMFCVGVNLKVDVIVDDHKIRAWAAEDRLIHQNPRFHVYPYIRYG